MPRKRRIPYTLDPGIYHTFPKADLQAIIRAADDMIASGGRTMLGKVLKGSKDKKLLALHLNQNPSYGHFSDITLKEIGHRVDWVIEEGYLRVEYDGLLPKVEHSTTGWEILKGIRATEFMTMFDEQLLSQQRPYNMEYLKDRNRDMITELIERVGESGEKKYIPILEDWKKIDYKKVQQMIKRVIAKLEKAE